VNEARATADSAGVEVRPLTTLGDAEDVVALERATWGEAQEVPREMIRALQGAGVPPLGAFDGGEMVGFVLGFVGAGGDGLHLHSHMLAVAESHQARGIGRALKLAQRDWALARGIETMRWTFDPLVTRNAHFNLNVLGAVADRFHRHYYGDMTDRINRGERTDRLEVLWDLRAGTPKGEASRSVPVPPDYASVRASDPRAAGKLREDVARQLEGAIGEGFVAVGFDRDRSCYLLAPGDSSSRSQT
jgi:predicted GNAT superfamily acetyltransferase